jgi:hypothetical protein
MEAVIVIYLAPIKKLQLLLLLACLRDSTENLHRNQAGVLGRFSVNY